MSRSIRAAVAAASCGVLLAGALAGPSYAEGQVDQRASQGALTDFGYRADVYGVKLVTNSVEALNLKDAHAQQLCTRTAGAVVERTSALTVPDNPLINITASRSRTETYRDGATHGVRGTSTIGDVVVGGTVGPLTTPKLVIKGLQTTAEAFNTPRGYGHRTGFTFASISLDLLDNTVVQNLPPELQQLLAPLNQVTDTVFQGTQQVAQQVFDVLADATKPIQIPGLGSIALGYENGRSTKRSAQAQATALRIRVTAGDRLQLVELGTARVRMGGPAPAGVFRAGGTAMDYHALNGALRFGGVEHKALQCEGSFGKTVTRRVANAAQLLPVPVVLSGITYQSKGTQVARKELARGWSSTSIGTVSIPLAQLEIKDVVARVKVRGKHGRRVKAPVTTSIGSITVGGQPVAVPEPGQSIDLPNGMGILQRQVVTTGYRGSQVVALRVKLFEEAVVVDLARATGRVYTL